MGASGAEVVCSVAKKLQAETKPDTMSKTGSGETEGNFMDAAGG